MKKLFVLLILVFGLNSISAQSAQSAYRFDKSVYFTPQDTLNMDLFFFGRNLEYAAFSSNDVISAGQNIHIEGNVGDDLYAGGNSVRLDGTVEDGVIIWAKEIIISGVIKGDARLWAGNIHIMDGAELFGDVYTGTGDLRIDDAVIHGNLKGGSYSVLLNGEIFGDIDYGSGSDPFFGENFKSHGKTSFVLKNEPAAEMANQPANIEIVIKPEPHFFATGIFYWFLLSAFVIGAIIIAAFGPFKRELSEIGQTKILTSLGTGFVFVVAFPFIVLFSLLFLPMSFILGALYLIVLYLAKIFVAFIAGSFVSKNIFNKEINPYLSFAIGLILLSLILQVPIIGVVVYIAALLLGCGAFLIYLWQIRKA